LSLAQSVGIGEGGEGKSFQVDLDHGEIRLPVLADQPGVHRMAANI
jgi:hypothetical protein